ncbi:MAG: flagellar biosynthesis protein FlhA [Bdellovibrionaceae bacterium]|nr:flagellar biosynthesis protein FlhA [Pseudobdellovibrionaceae bacterium]|tara:strand:- start:2172 stop:4253 length:2082 start_codon:yes stop_codon:yes gene_type:complete
MSNFFEKIGRNSDLVLAVGLVGILAVMVIPLPPFLIDILLSFGIAGSVVLLLTSVYASRALDFSIFPTLLLMTTLFRLSLNVATTRVILLRGADQGTNAAGEVIQAFGDFVVGGNYAVGIVIFIILVIINFIVITKGAGRVAEVAARFTLDAMPGKQMAIDADLNAGIINEKQARDRRDEISREADFYGAMDGASKFVRGDAIAGMLIVMVNILGGIVIGTLQRGMDVAAAAETFTLLTIGDGLVSQIPALIISTAAGIIVTRTASGKNLGSEFSKQLFMHPKTLFVAAGVMGFLGIVPGLPAIPFFLLAVTFGGLGYRLQKKDQLSLKQKAAREAEEKLKPKKENIESLLNVDTLELEVGYGLINIVDADQNGDLLERVTNIRKQFATDLGIIVPPLRIRDNLELKPGDYQLLLKGVPIGSGSLMVGHYLAMDPGNVMEPMPGIPTKEPAFGLDAVWITEDQKEEAVFQGYTVVDLSTVVATHLTELVRMNSSELLGRQELQDLIDALKETAPKVIEDLIPNTLSVGIVLKVLKNLLKEGVSIRDLRTIFETLADHGAIHKDPMYLTEQVRTALGRSITKKLLDVDGKLRLITLDREIEESVAQGLIQTEQGQQLSLDPEFVRGFVAELNQKSMELSAQTSNAIVLCSPLIRIHLKNLVDRFIPNLVVLSHNEISPSIDIESFGTVRLSHGS